MRDLTSIVLIYCCNSVRDLTSIVVIQ